MAHVGAHQLRGVPGVGHVPGDDHDRIGRVAIAQVCPVRPHGLGHPRRGAVQRGPIGLDRQRQRRAPGGGDQGRGQERHQRVRAVGRAAERDGHRFHRGLGNPAAELGDQTLLPRHGMLQQQVAIGAELKDVVCAPHRGTRGVEQQHAPILRHRTPR